MLWKGSLTKHDAVKKRITCDVRPSPAAPIFTFRILSDLGGHQIEAVEIGSEDGTVQGHFTGIKSANAGEGRELYAQDVNFDGFKDYRLLEEYGSGGFAYFVYWVYVPDKKHFILHEGLRKLCNVELDATTRTILAEPIAPDCKGPSRYRLDANVLVLVSDCETMAKAMSGTKKWGW